MNIEIALFGVIVVFFGTLLFSSWKATHISD